MHALAPILPAEGEEELKALGFERIPFDRQGGNASEPGVVNSTEDQIGGGDRGKQIRFASLASSLARSLASCGYVGSGAILRAG